jgi:hypothetical protein
VNLEPTSRSEGPGDNNSSRCERIKTCIDAFLEKNPRLSLQSVEDKTGVPSSTLRRIFSLKGNPQPEAAIKIFSSLGHDEELYQYMLDFHPGIAEIMALKSKHNQEYDFVNVSDRDYFLSEDYALIVSLAYTTSGTTEKEISYELGQKGLERLQELLKKNIIEKKADGRYVGKFKNYKLSLADTKERIEASLRYYRVNEASGINNWISYQTESLNENGLKNLKLLQQKHFIERKEQIFNNPIYSGNLKVYSATVSSTFFTYTNIGELQ